MFTVQVGSKVIKFSFGHRQLPKGKFSAITQCWMQVDGGMFNGASLCSSLDVFNKDKGRKISLERAMHNAQLNREERTVVWHKYLSRGELAAVESAAYSWWQRLLGRSAGTTAANGAL